MRYKLISKSKERNYQVIKEFFIHMEEKRSGSRYADKNPDLRRGKRSSGTDWDDEAYYSSRRSAGSTFWTVLF